MKALEYLKKEREIKKHCADVAWGYYDKSIDEAIKELEDLKNRSCENCKYNKEQDNFMIFRNKVMCQDGSKMMWYSFTKDFSCKYWGQDENTTSSIY